MSPDPSPEPWDEWREKVDAKLKEVREMMKSHERACDAHNVRLFVIRIYYHITRPLLSWKITSKRFDTMSAIYGTHIGRNETFLI